MKRKWLLVAAVLCLAGTMTLARQGIVKTRDGRTIEGDITDKGMEGVTITTKVGASITIDRDSIAAIEYAASIRDLYKQRVAALPRDAGPRAHLELAQWLFDAKEYDLALVEAETALTLDANNADAAAMKRAIEKAMRWGKTAPAAPGTVRQPPAATRPAARSPQERRLLDADEINIIRQREIVAQEPPLRVRFDRDVRRRFVESQAQGTMRDFANLPPFVQAMTILNRGAPELWPDVKILEDPAALAQFKRVVQPIVLSACASSSCHGGPNAGRFVLNTSVQNDPATYTNFYILTQYSVSVDDARYKCIDRVRPTSSLLVQYGLPRDVATVKHPEVQGYTGVFRGMDDPRVQQIVMWMGRVLKPIEPDYGIDHPLRSTPTTAPAERPAPLLKP